jgi:hypothetical protein
LCHPDGRRGRVKFAPVRTLEPGPQFEAVAGLTWHYVQVDVVNLLAGCGSVRQVHVHAVAWQAGRSKGCREPLRRDEEPCADPLVKVSEAGGVHARYDQQMAGVDRLDVKEREDLVVGVDPARRQQAGGDRAERAVRARLGAVHLFIIGRRDPGQPVLA